MLSDNALWIQTHISPIITHISGVNLLLAIHMVDNKMIVVYGLPACMKHVWSSKFVLGPSIYHSIL